MTGAPNHRCGSLAVPGNISLFLPPYAPELNPQENIWDEIREKIFKNYALKSMDAVHAKLEQAILYVKSNPMTVKCQRLISLHHKVILMWKRYQ